MKVSGAKRRMLGWWQVPILAVYLLACLIHALLVMPLFLLPRFHREGIARRLGPDPWAWYTSLLVRPRVRLVGQENLPEASQGYLYLANHESMVDILVLTRYLRRPFLMKRSVLVSPIGWGTYLAGSIGLDRSSAESRKRALQQTIDMACRCMSVIVFPEGTFGHTDGRLRAPHLNGVRVAYDAGLSVLPIGLAGTRRALDGQSLPLHSNAEIALVIRQPLCPRDFCSHDAFATACWEEVTRAVSAARRYVPRGWPYTTGLC